MSMENSVKDVARGRGCNTFILDSACFRDCTQHTSEADQDLVAEGTSQPCCVGAGIEQVTVPGRQGWAGSQHVLRGARAASSCA